MDILKRVQFQLSADEFRGREVERQIVACPLRQTVGAQHGDV